MKILICIQEKNFLNGEKVFHDEFKKNLLNTKDFIHEFANKLINGFKNDRP